MLLNRAAWLPEAQAKPLVVQSAPFPTPTDDEIIVKNACVAINPVDYKLQDWDFMSLRYPAILGWEVAGEVAAIGAKVRGFQIGQRVIGYCHTAVTRDYKNAAFQNYTSLHSSLAAPIPNTMALNTAVVLPVAISTASAALFGQDNLALPPPESAGFNIQDEGSAILIWGGSTSVGCAAIQLARAVGLHVVTTAGKKNFSLCNGIGAHQVFDRASDFAVEEVVSALQGKVLVGALNAAGVQSGLQACIDTLVRSEGKRLVATTLPVEEAVDLKGVKVNFFHAISILQDGLASIVWNEFMPQALQKGVIIPKPEATVVGHGLEDIRKGLDAAREGYSASKLVVTL